MKSITKISDSKFDQLPSNEMSNVLGGGKSVTLDCLTVTPAGNTIDPMTDEEIKEIDAL